MGGEIIPADVRLNFDDSANPPTRSVLPDQMRTKQRTRRIERRPGQDLPSEDRRPAQRSGYACLMLSGMNKPVSTKLSGMIVFRNSAAN